MIFNSYIVKSGDTLESVSRSVYGSPSNASNIAVLNGVANPLTAGTTLKYVKTESKTFGDGVAVEGTADISNVKVVIDDVEYKHLSSVSYTESLINMRSLSFGYTYDENNSDIYDNLVFGKSIRMYLDGELNFTGFIKETPITINPDNQTKNISVICRSKASLLVDSSFPITSYPLEFNNLTIRQILNKIAGIKGVTVNYQEGVDLLVDTKLENDIGNGASAKVTETMYGFMVRLTKGRGLIISDTSSGDLYIQKLTKTQIDYELDTSKVTGLGAVSRTTKLDDLAQTYQVHCQYDSNNTFASATINGFPLPITKTIIADSNTEGNVDDLAKWTLCREVGKAIKYQIFISKSKIAEKPFKVGDLFRLISSKIRTDKNLVLERIEKDIGTNQRIVLTAVLPNSYNGVVPEIGELL